MLCYSFDGIILNILWSYIYNEFFSVPFHIFGKSASEYQEKKTAGMSQDNISFMLNTSIKAFCCCVNTSTKLQVTY
jgi:hypothetical protein